MNHRAFKILLTINLSMGSPRYGVVSVHLVRLCLNPPLQTLLLPDRIAPQNVVFAALANILSFCVFLAVAWNWKVLNWTGLSIGVSLSVWSTDTPGGISVFVQMCGGGSGE